MKNNKTALMIFSASLALATPLAFAQQATPVKAQVAGNAAAAAQVDAAHDHAAASVDAQGAMQAQAATPATPAVPPTGDATQATPAVPAVPAKPVASASGERKWSDLDGDGNGNLSAAEAASMPSLAKVFTQADADANGQLTQDEYKAWLASSAGAKAEAGDGKAKGKTKRGG